MLLLFTGALLLLLFTGGLLLVLFTGGLLLVLFTGGLLIYDVTHPAHPEYIECNGQDGYTEVCCCCLQVDCCCCLQVDCCWCCLQVGCLSMMSCTPPTLSTLSVTDRTDTQRCVVVVYRWIVVVVVVYRWVVDL